MTQTLTTEKLLEVIERCKTNEPSPHLLVCIDLAREMARELLANREAQPVAWTTPEELSEADCGDVWMWLAPRKYPGEIALYTVPPVPAVPEELVEEPDTWKTPDVVFGWNECRTATLSLNGGNDGQISD